jgi:hypothetical protein
LSAEAKEEFGIIPLCFQAQNFAAGGMAKMDHLERFRKTNLSLPYSKMKRQRR